MSTAFDRRVAAVHRRSIMGSIVLPLVIAIVVIFPVNLGLTQLADHVFGRGAPGAEDESGPGGTIGMVLSFAIGMALMCWVSRIRPRDLGYERRGALTGILGGAAVALVAITLTFLANVLFGGVDVVGRFTAAETVPLLVAFVYSMFQGSFEELIMRLYLMPHFAVRMTTVGAGVATTVAFVAMHAANGNLSVLAITNLLMFGVLFAVAYWRTGNAWAIGIGHGVWNYVLGDVYGSHVSNIVASDAILESRPVPGMDVLSGGGYGMEGSVVTTVVGVVVIAALWWWPGRGPRSAPVSPPAAATAPGGSAPR